MTAATVLPAGIERQIASGHFLEAESALQVHCLQNPADAHAWFLLGACRHRMGQAAEAHEPLERALSLAPGHAQAALAMVAVLCQTGRAADALKLGEAWLSHQPGDAQMHFSVGLVCEIQANPAKALAHYDRALSIDAGHAGALQNRGIVLTQMGRVDEAVQNNRRFAAACPGYLDAHFNLAESCIAARRFDEVVIAADAALALVPGHVPSLLDRGYAMAVLGHFDAARNDLRAALAHDDGTLQRRFAAWAADTGFTDPLDLAMLLQPEDLYLLAGFERVARCDWSDYDAYVARCRDLIDTAPPESLQSRGLAYSLLNLPIPAALQRKLADRVAAGVARQVDTLPRAVKVTRPDQRRIRIAYLTADFVVHPTSFLTLEVYALHDRSQFEIFAYALLPDDGSSNFRRIRQSCDVFADVSALPPEQIARRIAADGIDILIDMSGYKRHGRAEVLALRPASLQAGWVGYPATFGGNLLDYLIADHSVVPPSAESFYAEKIARLPHCNLPTSLRKVRSLPTPTRHAAGLPEEGVVFCVFFRHEKIEPRVFAAWMRILHRVPKSVLWLQSGLGEDNLCRHAVAAGIEPDRLIFASPLPEWDAYLARLRLADIYLDALYFNSHTQGSEALWAGVPIITCPGEHWVARVGASLLRAVGLEELIVENLDRYESFACELALNPSKLQETKRRLASNPSAQPLFDTPRQVRNLEAAYREMWRLHQSGAEPRSFDVVEPATAASPSVGQHPVS